MVEEEVCQQLTKLSLCRLPSHVLVQLLEVLLAGAVSLAPAEPRIRFFIFDIDTLIELLQPAESVLKE